VPPIEVCALVKANYRERLVQRRIA
jgi:hypothetical protein